ncbi:MAG TPA: hypothetical protein G4O00_01005 [Thermoflexia bacterium]|nr:hypothetical protein [Thermoflexia bacterium]
MNLESLLAQLREGAQGDIRISYHAERWGLGSHDRRSTTEARRVQRSLIEGGGL